MNPAYFTHIGKKSLAILLLPAVGAAGAAGAVRGSRPGEKVRPREEAASAEAVSFLTDVEQGRLRSAESGKPLLLFFTEPGSPFSRRVKTEFFADAGVGALVRRTVCVSIDTGRTAAIPLMKKFGVTAAPTVLLVSADGETSEPITRFRSPAEFQAQLKSLLRPAAWQ